MVLIVTILFSYDSGFKDLKINIARFLRRSTFLDKVTLVWWEKHQHHTDKSEEQGVVRATREGGVKLVFAKVILKSECSNDSKTCDKEFHGPPVVALNKINFKVKNISGI